MKGPGVYLFKNQAGKVLYIGQAGDLDARLNLHMNSSPWRGEVALIETIALETERERISVERELIRNIKPIHNSKMKDLPSNIEMRSIHYVWAEHWFYEGVKKQFRISSEAELASLLAVTMEHILQVRMNLLAVSSAELRFVAEKLGVAIYDLRRRFPKLAKAPRPPKLFIARNFGVPCIARKIYEVMA